MNFKPASTFMSPVNNPSVTTVCRLVEQDVFSLFKTNKNHCLSNLSQKERQALDVLSKDQSIVIRSADKGGAVVIQSKEAYRQEILHQLSDRVLQTP